MIANWVRPLCCLIDSLLRLPPSPSHRSIIMAAVLPQSSQSHSTHTDAHIKAEHPEERNTLVFIYVQALFQSLTHWILLSTNLSQFRSPLPLAVCPTVCLDALIYPHGLPFLPIVATVLCCVYNGCVNDLNVSGVLYLSPPLWCQLLLCSEVEK